MLDERISQIGRIQVSDHGHTVDLHLQCHQAVCYSLYWEAHGHPPTGNVFLNGSFANTTTFLTGLARMGSPVRREDLISGRVEPGAILVFVDKQLNAKHSCIALTGARIGGYNQLDWFRTPGIASEYSAHGFDDVRWAKPGVVRLNTASAEGFLVSIPTRQALLYFRGNFKPT